MKTLLDQEKENKMLLAERERNIRELTKQLNEAKSLLEVMPSKTYDQQRERETVGDEMKRLKELIASEEAAIRELTQPTDKEINDVLNQIF